LSALLVEERSTLPASASQRHSDVLVLLVILAVACLLRLALASLARVIRWDEPDYLILGINMFSSLGYSSGGVPELHYTPMFPIVSGLFYLLVRNPEVASDVVYILAGTLLIVPIYAIARRVYGQWTAVVTACFLAVFPALSASILYWGTMTEPLYLLLIYGGFYCALVALEDNKLWAYAASGALISLAYLTRPEASITLILVLGYLVIVRLFERRLFTRRPMVRIAVCALAFTVVAAPYLGFLYGKSGRLLITGKLGLTYAMGQAVLDKDPAEYDRLIASLDSTGKELVWYSPDRFSYSVLDDFFADPRTFFRRMGANARILAGRMFTHTIFPTFLGLPVLLGLLNEAWDRKRLRREGFLATIAVAPLVAFLPFHIEIRFFAPTFPILLMWSAHGLRSFAGWLTTTWQTIRPTKLDDVRSTRGMLALTVAPVILVLAFFLAVIPSVVATGRAGLDQTHKDAGLWLRQNAPAGAIIMARDLAVPLYAGLPGIGSPNAALEEVMVYARYHNAGYYVIDDAEINGLRPQLQSLLNEQYPPPGLIHVGTFKDGSHRTIVYQIQ
jgi:4-amino-4-deoxy-L-arabinose transferase-like glycosyltransferase